MESNFNIFNKSERSKLRIAILDQKRRENIRTFSLNIRKLSIKKLASKCSNSTQINLKSLESTYHKK